MDIELKANSVNQIMSGTVIFRQDKPVKYIAMILKGKVELKSNGVKLVLSQGNFIGITDVYMGRCLADYSAVGDVALFPFEVKGKESVNQIIAMNKDYQGLMVASLARITAGLKDVRDGLKNCAEDMFNFIKDRYFAYSGMCTKAGIKKTEFIEAERLEPISIEFAADEKKLKYYTECAAIPVDIQKQYFSYSAYNAVFHIEETSGIIAQLLMESMEIAEYIQDNYYMLCSDNDTSLFTLEAELSNELVRQKLDRSGLMELVDDTVEKINNIENIMDTCAGVVLDINRESLEDMYTAILTGKPTKELLPAADDKKSDEDLKKLQADNDEKIRRRMKKLEGALEKILSDADIEDDKAEKFRYAVNSFVMLNDRTSNDDATRNIRRQIALQFYDIYEALFLKYYDNELLSDASELLLDYGFADERLLSESNLYSLCAIDEEKYEGACSIYTMKEWLTLIYDGKREPSKNEFDEEYPQYLKSMRKRGEISEEDERKLLLDRKSKLKFEIHNMFAYNNRILSGQPSMFTPILYDEEFFGGLGSQHVLKEMLNVSVEKLMQIDFSVFDRESFFSNPDIGITKEVVIKQTLPDIIILPVYGSQASMWQDISGKRRDSAARFIFPMFTGVNVEDLMVKMFGRFRWEFCRTVQGAMWNNIQYKSLTSEYSDYIQFYRKNHDLSEDRKEKLKLQIQKGRNNLREIFLIDYEAWIKYEAAGAIKLNKVVREILATYCPFTPQVRDRLAAQPVFTEAMARFTREHAKKLHELENRYKMIAKNAKEIPEVITETLEYYRNL